MERAFGVLQALFVIVRGLAQLMEEQDIGLTMRARVMLHDTIVEDEQENYEFVFELNIVKATTTYPIVHYNHHRCYESDLQRSAELRDLNIHSRLQGGLMEELCKRNLEQQQRY